MRTMICLFIYLSLIGCCKNEEITWIKEIETKVIDISFVGVGGYGSPNVVRIWKLENGMKITMVDWKQEDVCVGDLVIRYRSSRGYTKWCKK